MASPLEIQDGGDDVIEASDWLGLVRNPRWRTTSGFDFKIQDGGEEGKEGGGLGGVADSSID